MGDDPYVTLRIHKTASQAEIKMAYRKMAMQFHPDRNPNDPLASDKFKDIKRAYNTLTTLPLVDRFPIQYYCEVSLTFKEAICGTRKSIQIKGVDHSIIVPSAIKSGEVIKYPLIPGENTLIVKFTVMPSHKWSLIGNDIIYQMEISIWDLILGAIIEVHTIYDTTVSVKIPQRTNPSTFLRLAGLGVKSRYSAAAGDMLVQLNAIIPTNISPKLLSAIKEHS